MTSGGPLAIVIAAWNRRHLEGMRREKTEVDFRSRKQVGSRKRFWKELGSKIDTKFSFWMKTFTLHVAVTLNPSNLYTARVPKLGYMYPWGYICLSEGVHSKIAIEEKNIIISISKYSNIQKFSEVWYFAQLFCHKTFKGRMLICQNGERVYGQKKVGKLWSILQYSRVMHSGVWIVQYLKSDINARKLLQTPSCLLRWVELVIHLQVCSTAVITAWIEHLISKCW